jgi:translation initiation factor 2B subunit (eIF-2B alpha/beta/delta family)/ADP-ribose pyrophosphatase YjhB (NUDIX family)
MRHLVTVFPRNRGAVLLCRRSETTRCDSGLWGAPRGEVETPSRADARRELREGTGIDTATLVRTGDPVIIDDEPGGERRLHPFLFDCPGREVELGPTFETAEWVAPTAILDRETVPGLWAAYGRVRPRVRTVSEDTEHGSATISVRALQVLRDEAGRARRGHDAPAPGEVARELLTARPAMTAVRNRINRAMSGTDSAAEVERAAHGEIRRALQADREAAGHAAELVGDSVATLSRSGTVERAIERADPGAVLVAESRPGREGVGVARRLAPEREVTLTSDAAFADRLAASDVETLLVGADTVLADGCVCNKAGTRGAALAAAHEGIDVLVVTATDKISPGTELEREPRPAGELYDGSQELSVDNPTFDVTPAGAVDGVVTERGVLEGESIRSVATEHRKLREWSN